MADAYLSSSGMKPKPAVLRGPAMSQEQSPSRAMVGFVPEGEAIIMFMIPLVEGGDVVAVVLVVLAIAVAGIAGWLAWRLLRNLDR
jgi:hypothetical protein